MNILNEVKYIITRLNKAGFEAYLVGGCVRDFIMNIEPHDFDITTNALPLQIKSLFDKTVDTGLKHGTVTVIVNNLLFEVTTYRIDGEYLDNRRPKEIFYTNSLIQDLERRDFTMNAVAYHFEHGFVDPFNGIVDIKNKVIRGVGNPAVRFLEDALRMLRALRFMAQLNFSIEEGTFIALKENVELIQNISMERIHDEFIKLLVSDNPNFIVTLIETNMLSFINKTFYFYLKNNYDNLYVILEKSPKDRIVRLSILFWYMECCELKLLLKDLKFDNKTIKYVAAIVKYGNEIIEDDYYCIRKILSVLGKEKFLCLICIKKLFCINVEQIELKLNKIIQNKDCFCLKDLKIDGNDLKILGVKPGIEIGKVLKYLLDEVMKEPKLNKKEILQSLVKNFI